MCSESRHSSAELSLKHTVPYEVGNYGGKRAGMTGDTVLTL